MFQLNPSQNTAQRPSPRNTIMRLQAPQFGLNTSTGLTQKVDTGFHWLEASRTRAMLVEDFVGFGLLRTGLDLFRGYFFGDKDPINIPIASERLLREVGSILTDNVSSGVAAYYLGKYLDKKWGAYSNKFTSFGSLELFQRLLKTAKDENEFLSALAKEIAPSDQQELVEKTLKKLWEKSFKGRTRVLSNNKKLILSAETAQSRGITKAATQIAKSLKQDSFDLSTQTGHNYRLNDILSDALDLKNAVAEGPPELAQKLPVKNWVNLAEGKIQRTLKAKNWKLPCLLVGLSLTFSVPYLIRGFTQRVHNINFYPGNIGLPPANAKQKAASGKIITPDELNKTLLNEPLVLRSHLASRQSLGQFSSFMRQQVLVNEQVKNTKPDWLERMFPYLTKETRRGNWLPAIVSAIPLVFSTGLFDTINLKWNLPLKNTNFLNKWKSALDFGKSAPFTTQQQIATMFAFLIFSRLTSARERNEFRERTVDSFLGWILWIFGTPAIQRMVGRFSDKHWGTELIKDNGFLKNRVEIEKFLTGEVLQKTRKAHIWLGAGSLLATLGLIGIIEPLLAIQWTKHAGRDER